MKTLIIALLLLLTSALPAAEVELTSPLLGGSSIGFGILVENAEGTAGELVVTRNTVTDAANIPPSYFTGWSKLCFVKIIDPDGKCAGYADMGVQTDASQTYRLKIPAGKPGIWRFTFNGGLNKDVYHITFPEQGVWGIRGEMGIGITDSVPRQMYLYVPKVAQEMSLYQWHARQKATLRSNGKELDYDVVKPRQAYGATLRRTAQLPKGSTIQFDFTQVKGNLHMVLDGMPFVLCPTPHAAEQLKSGLIYKHGTVFQGPVQQRAYELAQSFTDEQLNLPADFEKKCARDTWRHDKFDRLQILDRTSPIYGNATQLSKSFNPKSIAEAINFRDELSANCAYLPLILSKQYLKAPDQYKKALAYRTALAMCFTARYMQGNGMLRTGFMRGGRPDPSASFDRVYGHAHAYKIVRSELDEHTRDVLDDFVTTYVDKMIPFAFYESNQFMHCTISAYYVYEATGLPRFKRYFEDKLRIFLTNAYGGKHGQHPSGFYVEEGGPDGHYDYMSMWPMGLLYYSYCKRSDADPQLAAMIKQSLEKNLYFKSFYAIAYPDGEGDYALPYANNHRTHGVFMRDGYPGMMLLAKEFDLAFSMKNINTREHPVVPSDWYIKHWGEGGIIYKNQPLTAKRVELPFEAQSGIWSLPSQIAYKLDCGLYGLSFYHVYKWGHQNAGPLFVWSDRCGLVIASLRNKHKGVVKDPTNLTFSCVYGTSQDGKLHYTGKNLNRLDWLEKDKIFTITEANAKSKKDILQWKYVLDSNSLTLQAKVLDSDFPNPILNLPFYTGKLNKDVSVTITEPGTLVYQAFGKSMHVSYPPDLQASLEQQMDADVTALRITLPEDRTVNLRIHN